MIEVVFVDCLITPSNMHYPKCFPAESTPMLDGPDSSFQHTQADYNHSSGVIVHELSDITPSKSHPSSRQHLSRE